MRQRRLPGILRFHSRLKDAPDEGIEEEAMTMLGDLGLEAKAKNYSSQLSGGMKRKLSIAIAFIGNSTTVILDEPTAGTNHCTAERALN